MGLDSLRVLEILRQESRLQLSDGNPKSKDARIFIEEIVEIPEDEKEEIAGFTWYPMDS